MQRVGRLKFFILATIACVILFCIAAFSVSLAEWTMGEDSPIAEVDGKSGLFYVEYPQYAETEEVRLNADKYYVQVKQTDNSGAVTGYAYYPMADHGTAVDGRKEYNVKLGLDESQSVYLYKGNTAISDVQKDSNWTANGTLTNGKFTATSGGVFDFYFKEGSDEGSTEVAYPYTVKLELTCSGNKTYSMYFNIPEENLSKVYLWLWSSSTNYSGGKWPGVSFEEIKSKNYSGVVNQSNLFKVSGVKAENLNFIISYNNTDPRPSSGNPAKQTDTMKFSGVFSEGDNYKTITASSSSITITDTAATGTETAPTTNALYVGYSAGGTVTPPTPIVQATSTLHPELDVRTNKATIEKNAEGRFVYHNYICVSRKNHIGDDDNSMAFVELSLADCSVNPYNIIVKSLNITRKSTNANGVPNGGTIEPAPRIYNYDPTVETRLGPDPSHVKPDPNGDENRFAILTHGNQHIVNGEGAELDDEEQNPHMVNHYDDGSYIVLFFSDKDQQYFALDIEIELELDKDSIANAESIDTLEFTLRATASNLNNWQRYEDGYGMPWGFYMGGLINDVWLWDPRRTTQMEVASGSVKLDDPSTWKTINYNDGKGDIEYPAGLVDLSLTVNLIKGSTVKMYMIDNEGHRLNGNTIYLMPHAIEYDAETKKLFVDNPDYPIYDEDLNIVIPKTGSYMFRLVGHVRKGDETLGGMSGNWFRLQDGVCLTGDEVYSGENGNGTDKETGSACKNLPAYNLIVDRLYITSSEGKSTCEITLNANGGKFAENNAETVKRSVMFGSNIKVSKLPIPTHETDTFGGWYTDAACTTAFVNNTPATGDMTLYAKWDGERYTVSFDRNGGTWVSAAPADVQTDTAGILYKTQMPTADKLTPPAGTRFIGWYTLAVGGEQVDANEYYTFTGSCTVYAHWEELLEFEITFNTNGGKFSDSTISKKVTAGEDGKITSENLSSIGEPTYVKYKFVGWYDTSAATGGTEITTDYEFSDSVTVYARWIDPNKDLTYTAVKESFNESRSEGGYLVGNLWSQGRSSYVTDKGYQMTLDKTDDYSFKIRIYLYKGDTFKLRVYRDSNGNKENCWLGHDSLTGVIPSQIKDDGTNNHNIVVDADGYYSIKQWWANNPGGGFTIVYDGDPYAGADNEGGDDTNHYQYKFTLNFGNGKIAYISFDNGDAGLHWWNGGMSDLGSGTPPDISSQYSSSAERNPTTESFSFLLTASGGNWNPQNGNHQISYDSGHGEKYTITVGGVTVNIYAENCKITMGAG